MTGIWLRPLGVLLLAATAGLPGCATPSTSGQPPPAVEASSTQPADTVARFLRSDERFTLFAELMSSRDVPGHDASFMDVVDTEADPGTLFAPTDRAFEALGADALGTMLDAPWLTTVLEKHLVHGTHLSSDLTGGQLQTWGVQSHVTVEIDGDSITYGGVPVVERDIRVGSWVIHVLDGVFLPPYARSQLSS